MLRALLFLLAVFIAKPLLAAEPLPVVASFSILADLTQRVGGERIKLHTLVGPNADSHVYQPTPADAKALAQARLVIINGLGFEGWIERLVKSSGYRGPVVVASRGARTLKAPRHDHHHDHGGADPHAWLDPANARLYVANIANALIAADPAGEAGYRARADRLIADINALDADIHQQLDPLPASRRVVVSSHESLGYFGRAYGITFRAPVGLSTDAAAAARDVGKLIRQIRQEKIPAVFMENIADPRLLERIRSETGVRIGGTLYSDALSDARGPAATYLAMMRHNAATLAAALKD